MSFHITGVTVLVASFVTGLTFAWKKVPIDTMVQESLPDGYRGRVFSVYDGSYNLARLLSAAIAVPLFPRLGDRGTVVLMGVAFILWTPVLPRWIGRTPEIDVRTETVVWGGVEEAFEVRRRWTDEAGRECLRLTLADATVRDVSRSDGRTWRLDGESSA